MVLSFAEQILLVAQTEILQQFAQVAGKTVNAHQSSLRWSQLSKKPLTPASICEIPSGVSLLQGLLEPELDKEHRWLASHYI